MKVFVACYSLCRSQPLRCSSFVLLASLMTAGLACGGDSRPTRLVVVLYPQNNDGSPGNFQVDQAIRSTFAAESESKVEIYNEYLDLSLQNDSIHRDLQLSYLQRKYAGRKVDLVIAGLSPALKFAVKHREMIPGAPIIFCAVDQSEVRTLSLPADVIGAPIEFDLKGTLQLALQLHPETRQVAVIAGNAPMDLAWEQEARKTFQPFSEKVQFRYLSGLAENDLLQEVDSLPDRSLIYYIHAFGDRSGRSLVPALVLESLAQRARVPIYGHVSTYVGRGIVGGHVFSFEDEGRRAASLGLRLMAGESPQQLGIQPVSPNKYLFDGRQLARWGISESTLPVDSTVLFRDPGFWLLYKWYILGAVAFCLLQSLLLVVLLLQVARRRHAEQRFRRAVNAAPNGMLMVNREGRILLANAQLECLFGYAPDELIGLPVENAIPGILRPDHSVAGCHFLDSPASTAVHQLRGRRRNGTEFPVEVGLSSLLTEAGECVLAAVVDISELRLTEERLGSSQRQLLQLSGSLIGAQEAERRRIARELHDDFSQSLALISIDMDLLRQKPPESVVELGTHIQELSTRVRSLSSSIHELSHELHPLKLDQLGLEGAIRGLCQETSRSHQLQVEFAMERASRPIPAEISLCMYRVAQESLRNIIRHSGAASARVALNGTPDQLSLNIMDQGVGFDASQSDSCAGLGLISMRERLRLVGGELKIDAQPGRGTQVDALIPLPPVAEQPSELRSNVASV